jgi:phosphoribosylaminoimidazole (AIR) synthetase
MEMLATFNCGIGMIISISKNDLAECKNHLKKLKIPYFELGLIGPRKSNRKIIF